MLVPRSSAAFLATLLAALAPALPARAGGGPDAYGYTWLDSLDPGGPAYDAGSQPPWAGGGLCEDEWYTVNIGFTFPFYGQGYSKAVISANGALYLSNSTVNTAAGGDDANACPLTAPSRPRIAALWDDYFGNNDYLLCGGGTWSITSVIGWATAGAAGSRVFELSWIANEHFSCGTNGATFTVKLFEGTGVVEVHYQDVTLGSATCDAGASATVGISDAAAPSGTGSALQVGCGAAGLVEAGYAVRFVPPGAGCADADGDGHESWDCGGDDCADTAASIHPGAAEACNGIDDDCDGGIDEGFDADGDGASSCGGLPDCWEGDPGTHPGAAEVADHVDNDCDGVVDEGTASYDDDGDGFTEAGGDCDDADPGRHPGAVEVPDGVDDDCDGIVDEGTAAWDDDGDGFSEDQGDCDDSDPGAWPGAVEVANGADDDCDGTADDGLGDGDGDGRPAPADCDDADPGVHPGAAEAPNGVDDDCDGLVDEGTAAYDDDGDGFSEDQGDCADADASVRPGGEETENGVDDDCDGMVDEGTAGSDDDGDGFSERGGDCDDGDPAVHPGAAEAADGVDGDCDGVVDEGTSGYDDDGDGVNEDGGDCDDADPWSAAGLAEVCDRADNDCDGDVDEGCSEGEGKAEEPEGGCACGAAGGRGGGAAGGLGIGLAALVALGRRRRLAGGGAGLVAAGLLLGGCGSDIALVEGEGALTVTPGVLDLGAVLVGGEGRGTVLLDNTGRAEVNIASVSVQGDPDGAFAVEGDPGGALPRGEGLEVAVRFVPGSAGLFEAVLSINSDAPETPHVEVLLRGQGASSRLVVSPPALDFGLVPPGEEVSAALTLAAEGEVVVEVDALELEDASGAFRLVLPGSVGEVPFAVPAWGEVEVQVWFAPGADGPAEAQLRVSSSDLASPEVLVPLLGNSCEEGTAAAADADGDGYSACAGDCDDDVGQAHPGAPEVLDGLDNDCDGVVDEGTEGYDDDGDGHTEVAGDCDDTDPGIHPGAAESADGVDEDCDGIIDDGTSAYDDDGDGASEAGGDCDDADPAVHPGAAEAANGVDDDCDGVVDEGTEGYDDDGDGFSELNGDCHDADPSIHPGAPELADGVDQDCDGAVDEGTAWGDDDGDGFAEAGGDCDDTRGAVHPGATEVVGNGRDDDCDGVVE